MSVQYQPVIWGRAKFVYDLILLLAVGLYLVWFLRFAPGFSDNAAAVQYPILRMRAFGSPALIQPAATAHSSR
ncbi:MAG: (2Fe-2S)-binding protein, partial [Pseudomonadota bacterium]